MKKVYIPTKEELRNLQNLGINVYKYMLIRVIEALIIEDTIYGEHDMLEFAYDNLSEFPEIISSICRLYPERIQDCERASKDIRLCQSLIDKLPETNLKIYGLDNLTYFNQESDILLNSGIVSTTVRQLADKLLYCPKYRFDYKEPNILLDNIFACELPESLIATIEEKDIITIDPIYAIKLGKTLTSKTDETKQEILFHLNRSMIQYNNRYLLSPNTGSEYQGKDIVFNPDERVKKLVRCLEEHKMNCQ